VRAVRAKLADGSTATYWYCRETGTRLPDPETDPEAFTAAVTAARAPRPARWPQGSLGAVVEAWRRSPAYTRLAESTQRAWDHYLKALSAPSWSARPVASLTRGELLGVRDAIAEERGHGAANVFHVAVGAVFTFAVERDLCPHHPLLKARKLEGGHLPAWPEGLAQLALAWRHRERLRRGIVLAYYTGLRRGDIVALRWDQRQGGCLVVQPQKTRRTRERKELGPLRIPEHPSLSAELDAWQAENRRSETPSLTVLTRADGLPWTGVHLSQALRQAVIAEKLPRGLNLHGFRKLSATRLAEAGATASEIAALHGWETLDHVELYTRSADQHRLAERAVQRLASRVSNAGKDRGK